MKLFTVTPALHEKCKAVSVVNWVCCNADVHYSSHKSSGFIMSLKSRLLLFPPLTFLPSSGCVHPFITLHLIFPLTFISTFVSICRSVFSWTWRKAGKWTGGATDGKMLIWRSKVSSGFMDNVKLHRCCRSADCELCYMSLNSGNVQSSKFIWRELPHWGDSLRMPHGMLHLIHISWQHLKLHVLSIQTNSCGCGS